MDTTYHFFVNGPFDRSNFSKRQRGDLAEMCYDQIVSLEEKSDVKTKVGIEIEFTAEIVDEEIAAQRREELIKRFSQHPQIKEIKKFSPQELMMFAIHEHFADILEYRFGKSIYGEGYYDAPGCLEIRVKHYDPIEAVSNYHRLIGFIKNLSADMGIKASFHSPQPHVSLWQGSNNLNADKSEEGIERIKHFSTALLTLLYDAKPYFGEYSNKHYLDDYSCGAGRTNFLRHCGDNLEIRLNPDASEVDMRLLAALVVAAAACSQKNVKNDFTYKKIKHGHFCGIDLDSRCIARKLNEYTIAPNGTLEVLADNVDQITERLERFIVRDLNTGANNLLELMQNIKVKLDGSVEKFPVNTSMDQRLADMLKKIKCPEISEHYAVFGPLVDMHESKKTAHWKELESSKFLGKALGSELHTALSKQPLQTAHRYQ